VTWYAEGTLNHLKRGVAVGVEAYGGGAKNPIG